MCRLEESVKLTVVETEEIAPHGWLIVKTATDRSG